MQNDDGTGRLRFELADLVAWQVYVWDGNQRRPAERMARIVSLTDTSATLDTSDGPLEMPLDRLRKIG